MKVVIGETTYTKIKSLSFDPEADVTGDSVPTNQFSVDIQTTDDIAFGEYAYLYDDLDNLWAKYWIIYAEHMDKQTVRVRAQSALKLLERRILGPVMYNAEPVTNVIADIFDRLGVDSYTLDQSLASETITGFCPEQSAKNRLIWVCFVICAYVKSFFSDKIEIAPIDDTETLIPINKIYWKPKITYSDYVTRCRVVSYSYQQGTPATTDTWVTDGTNYYIQSQTSVSLGNPDVPQDALVHEITVDCITIVNSDNVDDILTHISQYYFKRMQVEFDAINNAEYMPGDRITAYADEDTMFTGFINKTTFTFGLQAKSTILLTPVEIRLAGKLIIEYIYNTQVIGDQEYTFPVGYEYEIEMPYHDWIIGEHRYVYRPVDANVSGTMVAGETVVQEPYQVALDLKDNILHVVSVDDLTFENGVVIIR